MRLQAVSWFLPLPHGRSCDLSISSLVWMAAGSPSSPPVVTFTRGSVHER